MIINKIDQTAPIIRKDNFRLLFPEIKDNSFDQNIKYWIKINRIISLKRGLYIFTNFWDKCYDKDKYLYYLSSMIYFPSYVSKETVMAKYGLLGESVYGISCVTKKTFRTFSNKLSVFTYSKIKDVLFTGFTENDFNGNKYFIASKSKALFDYLYFYKRKINQLNSNNINELRINFENMTNKDWNEFEEYLKMASSNKLNRIYTVIKKEYVD